MIEIVERYTRALLYKSETATKIGEAVVEAVSNKKILRGADLSGADLRGADLSGADLSGADLSGIRDDLFAVLAASPTEVCGLLTSLRLGRIDGSTYSGACACLVGTIANVCGRSINDLGDLKPDSNRPAERWFLALSPGDTPQTSQVAKVTEEWILEWLQASRPESLPVVAADDAFAAAVLALNEKRQSFASTNDAVALFKLAGQLESAGQ